MIKGEPIPKAGFATLLDDGSMKIDLALMRASDPAGATRLEYLADSAPSLAKTETGAITLEGAAGIAMGQWACRRLRDAVRAATGTRDADAHLDSVRKALESEAPAVLRRMPVADGVSSRRRSKATAAAESQLSLFDARAGADRGRTRSDAV